MVRAAFSDLDKTVLNTSSSVALSGLSIEAGLMSRYAALASILVQLPYSPADANESRMEQTVQTLGRTGRGWSAALLEAAVEGTFERTVQSICHVQALTRIEQYKRTGDTIVIALASVERAVRLIAQMLGVNEILASCAAVNEDECFTGEITRFSQAQGKADVCEALAHVRDRGLSDCSAYSDSVSDAPLLRLVDRPCAVNPDHGLCEMVQREDWPTLTFTSTVRVLPREVPISAKVAVPFVAGIVVGAAVCALLRR